MHKGYCLDDVKIKKGPCFYKTHLCLIWSVESVSLLKLTEDVKNYLELQVAHLDYEIVNAYQKHTKYSKKIANQLIKY